MPKTADQRIPKKYLKRAGAYKRTKSVRRINVHGLPVFTTTNACSTHPDRPKSCLTPGCNNKTDISGGNKQGYVWRFWCATCTKAERAEEQGFNSVLEYEDMIAERNGYIDNADANRTGYLKHRKDYCENKDGRLGFECPLGGTVINPQNNPEIFKDKNNDRGYYHGFLTHKSWNGLLEVDHKNGDPSDNNPENLQTLCVCCHKIKTALNGDTHTAGRKELGIA
jgi:hypothetical protein